MIDRQPDELGYIHGTGSADDYRQPGIDPADRFGLPHRARRDLSAAIDREDDTAEAISDNELEQRRYAMERAIIDAEKDRQVVELAQLVHSLKWLAVGMAQRLRPEDQSAVTFALFGKERALQFVDMLHMGRPVTDIDRALFRAARLNDADTIDITREEARSWKP